MANPRTLSTSGRARVLFLESRLERGTLPPIGRISGARWRCRVAPRRDHCRHVAPTNQVILQGLPSTIHFLDEPYWPMFGDTNKIEVLATTEQEGKSWPMVWTFQKGKGRVFGSILGHYSWTHDDPLFRILIFR